LLGTAAVFAAISAKDYAQTQKLTGTIRFYGCPAEESGSGKVFMIRAGAFSDCDVALTWHPDHRNEPGMKSTLATTSGFFRFHGVSAHAGRAPDRGRSALDAVMIMTHAVDLLREHMPQETRLHYIITKGGSAVNVVPELAELRLQARHPDSEEVDKIWSRIIKCAEAGALATETRLEVESTGGTVNVIPNEPLAALFSRNMQMVGGVEYSAQERAFAEKIRTFLPQDSLPELASAATVQPVQEGLTSWSTDVGDVSWTLPTGEIRAATFVPGVAAHTWQSTACSGMSIGQKGMLVAAKTLALTTVDLLEEPSHVQLARQNLQKRLAGKKYVSKYPLDAKPLLDRGKH
jgi:aminobenzoyl-glutamate utilization protein B